MYMPFFAFPFVCATIDIEICVVDGADGMKSMIKVNLNVAGHCRTLKIVLE